MHSSEPFSQSDDEDSLQGETSCYQNTSQSFIELKKLDVIIETLVVSIQS